MYFLVCQAVILVLLVKGILLSALLVVNRGWFRLFEIEQLHSLVSIEFKHLEQVKNVLIRRRLQH